MFLRELWTLGGQALDTAPIDSAPRLYIESLNETIDMDTVRVSPLSNRVPGPVLALEVLGAAFALGLLGVYLSILGRGVPAPSSSARSSSPCCCWSPSTWTARRAA